MLSAEREGELLRVSYEAWTEGYTSYLIEDGKEIPTEVPGRKVYAAVMTVALSEGGRLPVPVGGGSAGGSGVKFVDGSPKGWTKGSSIEDGQVPFHLGVSDRGTSR